MSGPHEVWLASAQGDLQFASLGLENGYYSQACFLAQQAAEKALKALLIAKCGSHPKIHTLIELVTRCAEHVGKVTDLDNVARTLDQYYLPSRYPNSTPGGPRQGRPSASHAREALDGARRILAFCEEHIGT